MKMSGGAETKRSKQMPTYTESSLSDAINKLASELIGHLKLDIEVNSETEALEASVKNEIYLIIREAVTNIQQHAQAERAMVTIETHSNRINLFIQDDGRGFSLENITKKPEGLMRIQESIKRLGAGYEMDTNDLDNGGVAHWIYIPLPIVLSGKIYESTMRTNFMPKENTESRRNWGSLKRIWVRQEQSLEVS